MPNSAVGSYFIEQSSGKWELHVQEDPASREYHRWPVGFVTTGFVRGRLVYLFLFQYNYRQNFRLFSVLPIVISLDSLLFCF